MLTDHTMPEEEAASPRLGRARTGRGLLLAWTVLLLAAAATGSPLGPSHPSLVPGNFARNIRNLECVSRKTQEKGTCMFALSCIKMNGTHLGVCVDRFYYGSCCKLPELQHEVDLGGGDTNDLTQVGVKKPVTAANVAETSTTTAAPVTTTKAPASTAKPTTKPPKPASTTTTRKPTAKPTSATKPTTKPTSAATKPTAKPTAKPTTASPPRKPVNATVPTKPSNTTKPAKPVTIPPPTYSTTAKPASTATKPSTAKPVATKPTTAKPTTSSKPSTSASKPSTTVAKPVPTKPTTAATKPPAQPASTAATQKPTTAKPTPKPTTVTSKPITTSTTVSNEVSTAASVSSKPSVEAVEEETNAVSGTQKPAATTGKPTPPTFPTSTAKPIPSAKPTPPTFPKPVSTQKPTAPTAAVTKPVVTSTVKPVVTSAKPANVTDENWVQVPLSTTSPASVATKPTQTYPDGSLFTEEIPPSVSRPTPPTFPPKPSTMAPTTYAPEVTDAPLNMSDYKQVCGRRLYPDARIVGGTRSTFAKWPWQISLRQWRTSTYLHKCGAALLNENWAITAAHCVENVPPSDLLLRLGEHDLSTEKEPHPHLDRRVQIVASHPQFDSRTFEYDLALLRFYEPVTFQPNVIPICIPSDDKTYIGETAFVTGWGRLYEDGPLPSVMQEVSVPVLENAVCETMYRSAGYIEHIPNIFICAGWKKGGFDSCEGDSGGPMVIQRDDKRWTLAGVISWGIGCAEPNQPGVYTRISHFRDWISQILQF